MSILFSIIIHFLLFTLSIVLVMRVWMRRKLQKWFIVIWNIIIYEVEWFDQKQIF